MMDYLVRVNSLAAAKTALATWLKKDDAGNDTFRLPQWCDILAVDAYTSLGRPAVVDDTTSVPVVTTPAVPPTSASGKWFIVSLDRDVTIPAAAQRAIQAQADRLNSLQLPAGIVGLSTSWAGMILLAG